MSRKRLKPLWLCAAWLVASAPAMAAEVAAPETAPKAGTLENAIAHAKRNQNKPKPDEPIPTVEAKAPKEAEELFRAGLSYYEGTGRFAGRSYDTAADYFQDAADLDHPEAIFYLASMYNEGKGVEEDWRYAEELYGKAARLGQPDSQMIVGILYVFEAIKSKPGSDEEAEALRQAARWMKNPAEKGIADAEFFYGDMLVKGSGLPKDEAAGIRYLKKSAEKNNASAQAMLGANYWQGNGVPVDKIEALKWLLLAHHGKNDNAQHLIYTMVTDMSLEDKKQASDKAEAWLQAYEKAHPTNPAEPKKSRPSFDFHKRD